MGAVPHDHSTSESGPGASTGDAATRTASRASGAPASLSALFSPLPERIDEFAIKRHIKTGGQGVVFEAVQASLDRHVAVKVAINRSGPDDPIVRRFVDEARLLAGVEHENVARVYAAGTAVINGWSTRYYAMELVPGAATLTEFAAARGLSTAARIALFIRVCDAVHAVHTWDTSPLLHRDLKPGNILVSAHGTPKIIDFGLARERDDGAPRASLDQAGSDTISGTLPYMSPEQCDPDAALTPASDVYALGVTLYELLSGRRPLDLPTRADDALRAIRSQPPAPLRIAGRPADRDLAAIVSAALEKRAEDRLPTAAALADNLRRYLDGRPLPVRDHETHYRVRSRARLLMTTRPLAGAALALLVSVGFAYSVGAAAVYGWTPGGVWFERAAASIGILPGPLDGVRLIAITDSDDLAALAAANALHGFDPSVKRSARLLHGRLLERLAEARPAVVGADIFFAEPSPYDDALERGSKALRDAGVGIVFGADNWSLSASGAPTVIPEALRHGSWGACTAIIAPGTAWKVDLAVDRGGFVLPSLALAMLAESRYPNAGFARTFDVNTGEITIAASRPDPAMPRVVVPSGPPIVVRATSVSQAAASALTRGLGPADTIGHVYASIPPDPALERITLRYTDAMTLPSLGLAGLIGGKAVILADGRQGVDRHRAQDGRDVLGAYAHVLALGVLQNGSQAVVPNHAQHLPFIAGGAFLGLASARLSRRPAARCALFAASALALAAASAVALRFANVLLNPLLPASAALFAGALALWSCPRATIASPR